MINTDDLLKFLNNNEISFFTGVPDSALKHFTFSIKKNHISVNNEGTAISLAAGYYLSTKKLPCIYMQNSGLGNAINPLISITNKNVYSIPSLLLIGWRGSPNSKDEPQHYAKGKITQNLLKLLGIKFCILRENKDYFKLEKLIKYSKKKSETVACLIEKGTFVGKTKKLINNNYKISRYDFMKRLVDLIKIKLNIISSTGFISRELNDILKKNKNSKIRPFYMVGGMGHSSSLALGTPLKTKKINICLDGDGSLLMHTGSLGISSKYGNKNYKYILFRNDSHESVGNQTTNSKHIDFRLLSKAFKFKSYFLIENENEIKKTLSRFLKTQGPVFLEVRIKSGSINNLGRPKNLKNIKSNFMRY